MLPLPNGLRDLRVSAATAAHQKLGCHQLNPTPSFTEADLLHITLGGK